MTLISNQAIAFVVLISLAWIGTTGEVKTRHALDASPTKQNSAQKQAKTTREVEHQLQQTVDWDFEEVRAIEVFEEIKERFDINVYLDQSAKDDSLSEDTPITSRLKNVRMATALRFMLGEHNATYVIHDGMLRFISLDVASDPEFFRRSLFDCRELLKQIAATDNRIGKPVVVRILPIQHSSGGGGFGGGGGGGGVFNVSQGFGGGGGFGGGHAGKSIESRLLKHGQVEQVVGMQEIKIQESTEESSVTEKDNSSEEVVKNVVIRTPTAEGMLLELIKTMVDPDGWDNTNGDGSMMIMSGVLVVAQSEDVLDEIGQLLRELETALK